MLNIPTWSKVVTALVVFFGLLIALPNALPKNVIAKMPGWLPTSTVSLGLDLQGGSYLLLEVELDKVQKDRLVTLVSDIRAGLQEGAHRLHRPADQQWRQRPCGFSTPTALTKPRRFSTTSIRPSADRCCQSARTNTR